MIFGKTSAQRYEARLQLRQWRRTFCWVPTRLEDGRLLWLEYAERKLVPHPHGDWWSYREVQ